jgi:hypothetical protein
MFIVTQGTSALEQTLRYAYVRTYVCIIYIHTYSHTHIHTRRLYCLQHPCNIHTPTHPLTHSRCSLSWAVETRWIPTNGLSFAYVSAFCLKCWYISAPLGVRKNISILSERLIFPLYGALTNTSTLCLKRLCGTPIVRSPLSLAFMVKLGAIPTYANGMRGRSSVDKLKTVPLKPPRARSTLPALSMRTCVLLDVCVFQAFLYYPPLKFRWIFCLFVHTYSCVAASVVLYECMCTRVCMCTHVCTRVWICICTIQWPDMLSSLCLDWYAVCMRIAYSTYICMLPFYCIDPGQTCVHYIPGIYIMCLFVHGLYSWHL